MEAQLMKKGMLVTWAILKLVVMELLKLTLLTNRFLLLVLITLLAEP